MKTNIKVGRFFVGGFRRLIHDDSFVPKKGTESVDDNVLKNFIWGMTNQKSI
ncbi:MAG: hypothetical protein MUO53_08325 [Maribacter sp.]|nr:hypothetical protein [Maribacter sp.]